MLIKKGVGMRLPDFMKGGRVAILLLCIGLIAPSAYGGSCPQSQTIIYYLNIADFALSFIEIPTSNLFVDSTTIDSSYLAGRAPLYDENDVKVGTCSASFLNMQTADGIFTDISNYISADGGLIVTWFTPTTLLNLELSSIIRGMVSECIVTVTTKVGGSLFFGKTFKLVVSSSSGRIYFKFTRTGTMY